MRHVFVALGCTPDADQDTDDDEDLEVVRVSTDELRRLLREDALTAVDAAYLALDVPDRL